MILPVAGLTPDGVRLEGEDSLEAFDWVPTPADVVHPVSPMEYRLEARVFEGELLVTGHAQMRFEGTCCRCGAPFSATYGDDVALSVPLRSGQTEVDLTSDLRETILLALPTHPTCSPDCQGLCPQCGRRLADGPCDCKTSELPTSWSALDGLLLSGGDSPITSK